MHAKLVVLGGGPGGYAAAFLAADQGLDVTLIESESRLGGSCLLRGCIPSKALLHLARVLAEVDELRVDWGVEFAPPAIQVDKIRARKDKLIATLAAGLGGLAKKRKVRVIQARGRLVDPHTLELVGDHASIPEERRLTFDQLVLATGSGPAMPSQFQVGSPRVMDSTGALALEEIPATLLVIGGGYIGVELGTAYARLGSQVSVVELTEGLLPGADRDLVAPLEKRLRKLFGDRIHLNTKVASLVPTGDTVEVEFAGGGKQGIERFDRVLVSVGRRPNSAGLGLESTRIEVDSRGFVVVDRQRRTAEPHIFAIGDLAGEPMLAHKASHEAKVAIGAALGRSTSFDKGAIPAVVFTDPEIAWAGLTEAEAARQGRRVDVASYPWLASGRAHSLGRTEGLTKWLVDPESQRVLGCGIVGAGAGELIAEAVLAIERGCTARELAEAVHPHPTLSETLMNAAEVFFGTATEIYKPRSG